MHSKISQSLHYKFVAFRDVALDRYIWYDTAVTVTVPQLYSDSHGFFFMVYYSVPKNVQIRNLYELNRKCSRYCNQISTALKIQIQEAVLYYKLYVFEICSNQWFEILKNCFRLGVHLFLDFYRFKWTFKGCSSQLQRLLQSASDCFWVISFSPAPL